MPTLYIKSLGRLIVPPPTSMLLYFQLNPCVETCSFAQTTLILGKGEQYDTFVTYFVHDCSWIMHPILDFEANSDILVLHINDMHID